MASVLAVKRGTFFPNFARFLVCRAPKSRYLQCKTRKPIMFYRPASLNSIHCKHYAQNRTRTGSCSMIQLATSWPDRTYAFVKNYSMHRRKDFTGKENSKIDEDDDEDDDFEERPNKGTTSGKFQHSNRSNRCFVSKNSQVQKTGRAQVRPSRYVFKDVKDEEEEDQRWIRRSKNPVSPKGKMEWYANRMVQFTRQNQVEKAQEMLDQMRDRKIKPTTEMFNILIAGFARVGKMRKAFHHFNNIKKMGLKPTPHTYTSLFNACAESENPQHAMIQAKKLWDELHRRINTQDMKPHVITYNAAIKAAAACGSPSTAFEIYDDMHANEVEPDNFTYAALLAACARVGEDGPSKALWVLEKMKECDIRPDIFVFNLVLKVMRDARNAAVMQNKTARFVNENSMEGNMIVADGEEDLGALGNREENRLKFRQPKPEYIKSTTFTEDKSPQLFSGVENFLQLMAVNEVIPDIRTFHLILQITDPGIEEEELVLRKINECNIIPDIPVLNTLVKRRAWDGDVDKAKDYIKMFSTVYGVVANEKTFECLASGCNTPADGFWLLSELEQQSIIRTSSVYEKLISSAGRHQHYHYLTELLKKMRKDQIQPSEKMIDLLDKISTRRVKLHSKSRGTRTNPRVKKNVEFMRKLQTGFCGYYKIWKQHMNISAKSDDRAVDVLSTEHTEENQEVDYDHL